MGYTRMAQNPGLGLRRAVGGASRRLKATVTQLLRAAASPHIVIRELADPNVARAFPAYRRRLRQLTLMAASVFLVVAAVSRRLLIPLLAPIGLAGSWYRWQARSGRGRRRSWPPGSIDLGTKPLTDPNYFLDQWEKHGPVFKAHHFREPLVCIVGLREAGELLRTHRDRLTPIPMAWDRFVPQGMARWMEPDLHEEYRSLLKATFGGRLLSAHEATINHEIDRALNRLAGDGRSGEPVYPLRYLHDMCFGIWGELFFGIPRDSPQYLELSEAYSVIDVHHEEPPPAVHRALATVERLATEAAATRPSDSAPTVLSGMIARQDGAVTNPTTMRNLIYLLDTSLHDMVGLLMWAVKHGCDNPEWWSKLRASEPTDLMPASLANRMVSETLRLEQSEFLYRRVDRPIVIGGYHIPAGWLLRVCVRESHRDPAVFDEPDRYNPDRFLAVLDRDGFAPFGLDDRSCVGQNLARLVARSLLTAVADGYRLETVQDGERELSPQRHWAPSSTWRVAATRQEANTERGRV